jgi:hypothetical protein
MPKRPAVLSLNDDELQIVLAYARPLQPSQRSEFLRTVASELRRFEIVDVGLIGRVCAQAQKKYFSAPSLNGVGRWH